MKIVSVVTLAATFLISGCASVEMASKAESAKAKELVTYITNLALKLFPDIAEIEKDFWNLPSSSKIKEDNKMEAGEFDFNIHDESKIDSKTVLFINEIIRNFKNSNSVKNPETELPSFSGVLKEYRQFKETFVSIIDQTDASLSVKFTSLKSKV